MTIANQDFEKLAAGSQRRGIVRELIDLLRETKKWWLAPVIIAILLLAVTASLSTSAAAPFIYSLF
jgi:hypothetical protein